jgi:NAD(P)-dependent dehydrogenase (short-subunit alcohol dehydrogenase family)
MSKAALNMAGKSLALDLAPRGITVVLLHPGFVRTEMTGGAGNVDPTESASDLIQRVDALEPAQSGAFLHADGETLPW